MFERTSSDGEEYDIASVTWGDVELIFDVVDMVLCIHSLSNMQKNKFEKSDIKQSCHVCK